MSIQKVIKQSTKNGLIQKKIKKDAFIYKVLVCLWDHICTFRGNGKSNLGLNLNYIYLTTNEDIEGNNNMSKIQKINALFGKKLKFVIEYKNVHFKRVLIKEFRHNVSIYELEKLKYCNVDLVKSTGDKIFDDYINFA